MVAAWFFTGTMVLASLLTPEVRDLPPQDLLERLTASGFEMRQAIFTCASAHSRLRLGREEGDAVAQEAVSCAAELEQDFRELRDLLQDKFPAKADALTDWFGQAGRDLEDMRKPNGQPVDAGERLWRGYDELLFALNW